jgi:hypothetical protein
MWNMQRKTRLEQELAADFKSYKRSLEYDVYEPSLADILEEEARNMPKEMRALLDDKLKEYAAYYSLELAQEQPKQEEISDSKDGFLY